MQSISKLVLILLTFVVLVNSALGQENSVLSLRWKDPSLKFIRDADPKPSKYSMGDSAFYFLYLKINRRVEEYILNRGIIGEAKLLSSKWQYEDLNTHAFKLNFKKLEDLSITSPSGKLTPFYEVTISDSGDRYDIISGDVDNVKEYSRAIVNNKYRNEYIELIKGFKILTFYSGTDLYFVAGDCVRDNDFSWAILGDRSSYNTPEWYIKIKALLYYTLDIDKTKLKFLFEKENYAVFEHGKNIISLFFGEQPTFQLNEIRVDERE